MQNFIMIRPLITEIHVLIINVKPKNFPGDSGQTSVRSICLKFASPTIRIKRDPPRSFLE